MRRSRTRPEGLLQRLDLVLAHLRNAEEELTACVDRCETHPAAARTQILGARAAVRNGAAAARMAKVTLADGTRPIADELGKAPRCP